MISCHNRLVKHILMRNFYKSILEHLKLCKINLLLEAVGDLSSAIRDFLWLTEETEANMAMEDVKQFLWGQVQLCSCNGVFWDYKVLGQSLTLDCKPLCTLPQWKDPTQEQGCLKGPLNVLKLETAAWPYDWLTVFREEFVIFSMCCTTFHTPGTWKCPRNGLFH